MFLSVTTIMLEQFRYHEGIHKAPARATWQTPTISRSASWQSVSKSARLCFLYSGENVWPTSSKELLVHHKDHKFQKVFVIPKIHLTCVHLSRHTYALLAGTQFHRRDWRVGPFAIFHRRAFLSPPPSTYPVENETEDVILIIEVKESRATRISCAINEPYYECTTEKSGKLMREI